MTDLMLMSNSFAPGRTRPLEHAVDALAELFDGARRVLFVPYASSTPDAYTASMRDVLAPLGIAVLGAHQTADPAAVLSTVEGVFVGGGNAFRLLDTVRRYRLLDAIADRVRSGLPYLGVSAGANLGGPTIRTTNDMPIVVPASLDALGLIPFQVNPHYPVADRDGAAAVAMREGRLGEFLECNDVPVLGLCEGSWLRVRAGRASLDGAAGGRLFRRGDPPADVQVGDDLSDLLGTRPVYDAPIG